jgi:hypothetical protein
MATVHADDIRVLARSEEDQPVLVLVNDEVAVVPAEQADIGTIVYTRNDLIDEFGEFLTDVDAETLAAGLTARLAGDGNPL